MKGIYLTQEGKQGIESKIAQLEKHKFQNPHVPADGIILGTIYQLKEILTSATILPVEESWHQLFAKNMISATYDTKFKEDTLADVFEKEQFQGVIIQPKQ